MNLDTCFWNVASPWKGVHKEGNKYYESYPTNIPSLKHTLHGITSEHLRTYCSLMGNVFLRAFQISSWVNWQSSKKTERIKKACCSILALLLLLHFLLVKLKLLSFEDVAIATTRLAWTSNNASIESTGIELISNFLVDDSILLSSLVLLGNSLGSLSLFSGFVAFLKFLLVQFNIVMLKIPLSKWIGINNENAILNNGFGSDKLVICGIVNDIKNSGLSWDGLRSPGKHSFLNFESTPF